MLYHTLLQYLPLISLLIRLSYLPTLYTVHSEKVTKTLYPVSLSATALFVAI
jgi:hypothetical protein